MLDSDHLDDTAIDLQECRSIDPRSGLYNGTKRGKSSLMTRELRSSSNGLQSIPIRPSGVVVHSYCQESVFFPITWATASSDYTLFEVMSHKSIGIAAHSVRSVHSAL